MIDLDHIDGPGDVIIPPGSEFADERFEALKPLAEAGKRHGSLFIVYVSHPVR